jgi:hypothetical protein
MPIVEDFRIYPALVRLAGCLCAEIEASGLPSPCFCGVVEGTEANLDCGSCEDGCGAAWVRLGDGFPTLDGTTLDPTATCLSQFAFTVEVGITRCFNPFSDSEGHGQGVAEHLEATRTQLADMAAMLRAINCCFANGEETYNLGQYSPLPFSGGCGGGTWTLVVQAVP